MCVYLHKHTHDLHAFTGVAQCVRVCVCVRMHVRVRSVCRVFYTCGSEATRPWVIGLLGTSKRNRLSRENTFCLTPSLFFLPLSTSLSSPSLPTPLFFSSSLSTSRFLSLYLPTSLSLYLYLPLSLCTSLSTLVSLS